MTQEKINEFKAKCDSYTKVIEEHYPLDRFYRRYAESYTWDVPQLIEHIEKLQAENTELRSRLGELSYDFKETVVSLLRQHFDDALFCTRDWSAWACNTMTEEDFVNIGDEGQFEAFAQELFKELCEKRTTNHSSKNLQTVL